MKPAFWCTATMRLRRSAGSASSSRIGKRLIAFMAGVYLTNMRPDEPRKTRKRERHKKEIRLASTCFRAFVSFVVATLISSFERARVAEDVRDRAVALMARVLENPVRRIPVQRDRHGPRPREHLRVVDRRLVVDRVRVDGRK